MTAYIVVACAEAFLRYPEMMRAHRRGHAGRGDRPARPGGPAARSTPCYLWSIANFFLLGRKIMAMVDPARRRPRRRPPPCSTSGSGPPLAYRGDGTRQAWDTGTSTPYDDEIVAALLAGAVPIDDDDHRAQVKRFNATLVNHLFLLYFDTRAGYGDTGPYPVPGQPGRTLLVRDYYRLGQGDFPWSDVAKDVPYHHLTAALVLDDVQSTFTDFGTSNHTPEDYLDRLVGFGLYTTDGARARRAPPGARRRARRHRRRGADRPGAALPEHRGDGPRREDPRPAPTCTSASCGRSPRWRAWPTSSTGPCRATCPSPLYQLMSAMQGENAGVPEDEAYYEPYPEDAP